MSEKEKNTGPKVADIILLSSMIVGSISLFTLGGAEVGEWVCEGKTEDVQRMGKPLGAMIGILCWALLVKAAVKGRE